DRDNAAVEDGDEIAQLVPGRAQRRSALGLGEPRDEVIGKDERWVRWRRGSRLREPAIERTERAPSGFEATRWIDTGEDLEVVDSGDGLVPPLAVEDRLPAGDGLRLRHGPEGAIERLLKEGDVGLGVRGLHRRR